jgi:hypothetical protein
MAKPRRSRGRLVSVGAARYGVFVRYGFHVIFSPMLCAGKGVQGATEDGDRLADVSVFSLPRFRRPLMSRRARQLALITRRIGRRRDPRHSVAPAYMHRKQPFWARLQLLARLTLNTRNDAANQPARLAQLDDGDDRAILVQGDEGPAQVVRLGCIFGLLAWW